MKKAHPLLIIALSAILFVGCKKELAPDAPQNQMAEATLSKNKASSKTLSEQLSYEELKAKLEVLVSQLPADAHVQMQERMNQLLLTDPQFRQYAQRIIDGNQYECDNNTSLTQWLTKNLKDWTDFDIFVLSVTDALNYPMYDAWYFENNSNQYFGAHGEHTIPITHTFRDLKRFWNISSNDIVLAAMHGDMLVDKDKMARMIKLVYGTDDSEYANDLADYLVQYIQQPKFDYGNHPIFTFNAFAISTGTIPGLELLGKIAPKIVMGDGLLQGMDAIGFGDVAPQTFLAHEFGHHIQYQNNLFQSNLTGAEATRRTELMADAFAAYYLSHARGASMQWKRVKQFLQVFYNTGDCFFSSNGHHGTPNQRMGAAEWGYSITNNAQKQGHILTSQEFARLFEEKLPELVAPDYSL